MRAIVQSHEVLVKHVFRELKHLQVQVGFFENAKYPDGTPIAYVAAIQEFGYPEGGIPSRSFMRTTESEKRNEWATNMGKAIMAAVDGHISTKAALEQVGMAAAGDISKKISDIHTPPLTASTVLSRRRRRKTPGVSPKPLVDTGQMLQAVDAAVVAKGAK